MLFLDELDAGSIKQLQKDQQETTTYVQMAETKWISHLDHTQELRTFHKLLRPLICPKDF